MVSFFMEAIQKYHDEDNYELTLLINGIRDRDEVSILKLYDNYAPALYGVVRKIILNVHEAEEVLQKVFIKVSVEIGKFTGKSKRLFSWLYNIARNEAIEALKTIPFHDFKVHPSNLATPLLVQKVALTPIENTILTLASYRRLSCIQIGELLQLPLLLVRKNMQSGYLKLIPQVSFVITKSPHPIDFINILKPMHARPYLKYRPF